MEILVSPDRHGRYATNMQFWDTFSWHLDCLRNHPLYLIFERSIYMSFPSPWNLKDLYTTPGLMSI